jgi:hypothetical protein
VTSSLRSRWRRVSPLSPRRGIPHRHKHDATLRRQARTSENSVKAKFAEGNTGEGRRKGLPGTSVNTPVFFGACRRRCRARKRPSEALAAPPCSSSTRPPTLMMLSTLRRQADVGRFGWVPADALNALWPEGGFLRDHSPSRRKHDTREPSSAHISYSRSPEQR